MNIRNLLAPAVAFALAGCSHVSLVDRSTAKQETFKSPASSEATYRQMINALEYCYPVQIKAEGRYFPEAKEGEIKFGVFSDDYAVRAEFFHAVVRPDGTGSVITYYTRSNADDLFNKGYAGWVAGSTDVCPKSTRPDPDPNQNWRGNLQ